MSGVALMLVYFTAMHANGPLLLLLGLPFDRVIPWHRLLALSATLQGFLHGLSWYVGGRVINMAAASDPQHHLVRNISFQFGMEITGVPPPAERPCPASILGSHELRLGFCNQMLSM